jgi:acetyl-CoA acetyltransferase
LGHPFAATGVRLIATAANRLAHEDGARSDCLFGCCFVLLSFDCLIVVWLCYLYVGELAVVSACAAGGLGTASEFFYLLIH